MRRRSPGATARATADVRVQDLAHHFTQAGDLERSLKYLRQAAANARRIFAHDEALKYLEQARESAEALQRDDDLAAVDEQAGDVHDSRGTIPLAIERYAQALSRTHDPAARAALKVKVGTAYVPTGDPRGLALLTEAAAELDPATQTNTLAHAIALIGRYHHYRAEPHKALEYLERAIALALPQDDVATLTDVYGYLAGAHQHLIQYGESDRYARLCIALGRATAISGCGRDGQRISVRKRDGPRFLGRRHRVRAAQQGSRQGDRLDGARRLGRLRPHRRAVRQGSASGRAEALATLQLAEQMGENRLMTWLDPSLAMIAADLGDDAGRQGPQRARVAARAGARPGGADRVGIDRALARGALQTGDAAASGRSNGRHITLRSSRAPRTAS